MAIKTDTATYPENPKSIQLPPAGGKYIDDLSGVEVLRFTDEHDGNGGSFSTTYSVWNAFNCDATRIWLFEQQGPYYIGNLNPVTHERVGPLEEVTPARGAFVDYETAFWSFLDRDKAFILVDCQIWSYKPSTKQYSVVADLRSHFPAGARFNQLYISQDDNRFAAVVRSGSIDVKVNQINGITMGKDGKYVLLVREDAAGGQTSQSIYNIDTGALEQLVSNLCSKCQLPVGDAIHTVKEMPDYHQFSPSGQPDYCIGHNDIGMDFTMAWQYAKTGWINWHVSLRADNDSWALVSTYAGTRIRNAQGEVVDVTEGPFVREIFQVGVKPPFLGQFRRLVHTRANYESPHYWYTPRATISRDGRLVCWTAYREQAALTSSLRRLSLRRAKE
jgi:hypothetical protein